jgi:hypothetical protein
MMGLFLKYLITTQTILEPSLEVDDTMDLLRYLESKRIYQP